MYSKSPSRDFALVPAARLQIFYCDANDTVAIAAPKWRLVITQAVVAGVSGVQRVKISSVFPLYPRVSATLEEL